MTVCISCPDYSDLIQVPQASVGTRIYVPFFKDISAATNVQVKIKPNAGGEVVVEFPRVIIGTTDIVVNGQTLLADTYVYFDTIATDFAAVGLTDICAVYFDAAPTEDPTKPTTVYVWERC